MHLAPLGGSRYDHITWYPPKFFDATTSTSMVYGKNLSPALQHTSFWPTKTCSIWKIYWKTNTVPVELMKQDLSMFIMQIYAIHLEVYSIFHCWLSECTQKSCLQRGVSIPSQQNSPGKFLLAQAQTLHKHPESCHVGVRPTRLLFWATNGQQPAATKGNVEQKPWHDIPLYCSSWWLPGFTNPSEKYKSVKLDNFPKFQGENQKKIWVATT